MQDTTTAKLLARPSLRLLAANTAATWLAGWFAPSYWTLALIGLCWIALGATVWIRLIKAGHLAIAAVPVFFVAVIGVGVSLPAEVLGAMLQPMNDFLEWLHCPLRANKVGHIFCFAMFTLFAIAIRHRIGVSAKELAAFILLLAIATEGIQLFIPIRTTSITDFCYDLLGAVIGFACLAGYKAFTHRAKSWSPARTNA